MTPFADSSTFTGSPAAAPSTASATARCSSPAPASGGRRRTGPSAVAVVRRAVELGVDFIDTADSYGPYVSEEIIAEALAPYPEQVVVATKAGLRAYRARRVADPVGRPEYLRQEAEMSLRRLQLEQIELFQLHRIDPQVPVEDQVGVLKKLQDEGKIGQIGLSEVSVDEIEQAAQGRRDRQRAEHVQPHDPAVARTCSTTARARGIAFIPWFPIANGDLAKPGGPVDHVVQATGATPAQVALAWLLARSPVMLPIPGTKSHRHLEENVAAVDVTLTDGPGRRADEPADPTFQGLRPAMVSRGAGAVPSSPTARHERLPCGVVGRRSSRPDASSPASAPRPRRWPDGGSSRAARSSRARPTQQALVRECREELGVTIGVGGQARAATCRSPATAARAARLRAAG